MRTMVDYLSCQLLSIICIMTMNTQWNINTLAGAKHVLDLLQDTVHILL